MRQTLTRGVAAGALALAALACNADRLTVPNYQNPTPESVRNDPVAAIQVLATGILRNDRDNALGFVSGVGILGRESYNYTPTEGRNTSGWLTADVNNQASFGGVSNWTAFYTQLRNIKNLLDLVEGIPDATLPAAQKSAVQGFAHTMEALALSYLIATRHDLGIPVEIPEDPTALAPFVSRDSAYNYILGQLELAKTELTAAGTATFPFTFHSGFTGFTTPANFLRFNRAIAARINAYRASLGVSGCGAARSPACYQTVLQNLAESFLPTTAITTTAQLNTGVFRVYSAAANDQLNTLSNANTTNQVAHAKSDSGVVAGDLRFTTKILRLSSPKAASAPSIGVPTNFDIAIYPNRDSPISIIRVEELLLLRAEAKWFTGDRPGATADLNTVRTISGGLAPIAQPATDDAFIDALLYERRWSLLYEGHRWIDMRRFGRLNLLTRDLANHIVATRLPVPQNECLQRAGQSGALAGPGCA